MEYKHSCVIDAENLYKTLVLVLLTQVGQGQEQEWKIQNYTLAEGEQLVDTAPPTMRPYAGAAGLVSPKWDADTSAWIEAATGEEIAAWEADHPDSNAKTLDEEKAERIAQSKDDLDTYLETHPITWTDGQKYSITREKQQQLTSKILSATLAAQKSTPYTLTWNATGEECAPWSLEDLAALAFAIDSRVTALVSYQQTQEVAMRSAATREELDAIVVNYDSVPEVTE